MMLDFPYLNREVNYEYVCIDPWSVAWKLVLE